jgi:hypothetical protein
MKQNCCICYEPLNLFYNYKMKCCNNQFHKSCINKWLKNNPSCPLCRTSIEIKANINKINYSIFIADNKINFNSKELKHSFSVDFTEIHFIKYHAKRNNILYIMLVYKYLTLKLLNMNNLNFFNYLKSQLRFD